MSGEWSPAPVVYRAAARIMFAPFGGLASIRQRALEALDLRGGVRVLELGCGPGDLTVELIARGAHVDAVDSSPEMLRVARAQAPAAHFELADIRHYTPAATYDVVLLAFVLHELPVHDVRGVLERSAAALATSGRVAILDHALPLGSAGRIWRAVLRAVESRSIDSWLALHLSTILREAALPSSSEESLAGGRVRLIVARRR